MKNSLKSKRIPVIIICAFLVIFIAAFVFTDLKLCLMIKLKLLTSADPAYQHGSEIYVGDDYILISTRLHSNKNLDSEAYLSCLRTAAEMSEYMYTLSQNDFWGTDNRSVYIECGHRGSGGQAPVESGIGYGINGMEYSDGYISTDDYYSSGKWITLNYCDDRAILDKCREVLSTYNYDSINIM